MAEGEHVHQMLHRGLDAVAVELQPGETQAHLDAGERAHQREIVEVAEVADAEHPALEPAQAGAERHVEALEDDLANRVGVDALRHRARR